MEYCILVVKVRFKTRKIDIFNITGEKIFSERSINKVDLHNLSTGIYILKIELDNKIEIHKIIKIK
jgi:hypothetical protein